MKKLLSIFPIMLIILATTVSASAQNSNIEEKAEQLAGSIIEKTRQKVEKILDEPVVVVAQEGGDTLFQMQLDSISRDTSIKSIVINVPNPNPDDEFWINSHTIAEEGHSHLRKIVAIGVIFPCITIVLIIIAIIVFLIVKNNQRNKVIYKAIENNYQLPESFYSSSKKTLEDGSTVENPTSAEPPVPGMPPIPKNMPYTPSERKTFTTGITQIIIGLFVFLFFISVDSMTAALLFGGILLAIGVSKIIPFFIFRNK